MAYDCKSQPGRVRYQLDHTRERDRFQRFIDISDSSIVLPKGAIIDSSAVISCSCYILFKVSGSPPGSMSLHIVSYLRKKVVHGMTVVLTHCR